jgi:Holliday junction resolvasome RuvABC endonuclease subunit
MGIDPGSNFLGFVILNIKGRELDFLQMYELLL